MVVYWHHCLFLDLQAHIVSLPGGASNTWLSCWAPSGEIAKYFSLTGELLLSAAFWCRNGAAKGELVCQSHPTPPWKIILDHRPVSSLALGQNCTSSYLGIWLEHWDLGRWTLGLVIYSKCQQNVTQDRNNVRFVDYSCSGWKSPLYFCSFQLENASSSGSSFQET